jgi:ribosomal protein S27AE
MFCKSCGTQLGDDDKFCSACGAPVAGAHDGQAAPSAATGNSPREQRSRRHRNADHKRPAYGPNTEAIAEFDWFVARKTKLKRVIAWPIAALFALSSLYCFSNGTSGVDGGILALAFALIIFFAFLPKSHLSASQYKALPGSAVRNDKPVCIRCGNAGIYLHGQYRSNAKFHDCSKCGVTLFTS